MSTFGIIIPGRSVDTNFQQVESNKFLITIPNADSLNHVVVFLTGIAPVPAGMACCLFFSMPDSNAPPSWNYLGFIVNEKPSAIFKLSSLTKTTGQSQLMNNGAPVFNYIQEPVISLAQLGISIEPLESVMHMVPAVDTCASNMDSFTSFMTKTVENLYNYCASFAKPLNELLGDTANQMGNQFVPLSAVQFWFENYSRRLSNDKNFWKSIN